MTHYDLRHEADGWWCVYRGWGGTHLCDEFLTVEEAERAIERYEREDEEAEREAREQDAERDDALQRMADESHEEWIKDRDDRMDRGDWEFHRDYDQ